MEIGFHRDRKKGLPLFLRKMTILFLQGRMKATAVYS